MPDEREGVADLAGGQSVGESSLVELGDGNPAKHCRCRLVVEFGPLRTLQPAISVSEVASKR